MLKTGSSHLIAARMESNGFLMVATPSQLRDLPSPRVLTTHRQFHELPSDFILKRRKMVCVIRDPKDVCVSHYHLLKSVKHADYDGTFDGFLTLFLNGQGKDSLLGGIVHFVFLFVISESLLSQNQNQLSCST